MRCRPHRRRAISLLTGTMLVPVAALFVSSNVPAAADDFSFGLIGDVPYGPTDEAAFDGLVTDVNNDPDVALVAHAGDIKGAGSCSDAALRARFDLFQTFEDPFWYTPGDNEWTDCRSWDAGAVPTERLASLRNVFFPDPSRTTGTTTRPVVSQTSGPDDSVHVENTRFDESCVTFGAIHVVGSGNGSNTWPNETATEQDLRLDELTRREAANVAWIDAIFDSAAGSDAVFVLVHARIRSQPPYQAVHDRLVERAREFDGPVIVANGDEHSFVETTRFLGVSNMTRWQTPGGTGSVDEWIKVSVDCSSDDVFSTALVDVGTTPPTTAPPSTTAPSTTAPTTTTTPTTTQPPIRSDVDQITRSATATNRAVRSPWP